MSKIPLALLKYLVSTVVYGSTILKTQFICDHLPLCKSKGSVWYAAE